MDPVVEDRLVKRSHVSPRETVRCSMALPGPSHFEARHVRKYKNNCLKTSWQSSEMRYRIPFLDALASLEPTSVSWSLILSDLHSVDVIGWTLYIEHVMLYIFWKHY